MKEEGYRPAQALPDLKPGGRSCGVRVTRRAGIQSRSGGLARWCGVALTEGKEDG